MLQGHQHTWPRSSWRATARQCGVISALGLVLYELYTGRRAFTATTLRELREQKESAVPTAPSELRSGVDPVVERVLARYMERDPRGRPASVAQIGAALPGGDPLAAALAAGETPSPEMVAASGLKEGLHPRVALALVVVAIAGTVVTMAMHGSATILGRARLTKSPDALADRARAVLSDLGYQSAATDRAGALDFDRNFMNWLRDNRADTTPTQASAACPFGIARARACWR